MFSPPFRTNSPCSRGTLSCNCEREHNRDSFVHAPRRKYWKIKRGHLPAAKYRIHAAQPRGISKRCAQSKITSPILATNHNIPKMINVGPSIVPAYCTVRRAHCDQLIVLLSQTGSNSNVPNCLLRKKLLFVYPHGCLNGSDPRLTVLLRIIRTLALCSWKILRSFELF